MATPLFHVQSDAESELQVVMLVAMDFLDTLRGVGWVAGLLLLAGIITWIVLWIWGCGFHKCGASSCFVQISQYILGILLLFFGFSVAFGAVGISFLALFAGASFVAAALVVSASDFTKDFIVGIQLLTYHTLDKHELVRIGSETVGHLRAIGLFTSELVPVAPDGERTKEDKVKRTILIPNRLLLSGPLDVTYMEGHERSTAKGSLVTGLTNGKAAAAASMQRVSVARAGVLTGTDTTPVFDIDAGTNVRWADLSSSSSSSSSVAVSRYDGTPSSEVRQEHARRFIEQAGLSRRPVAAAARQFQIPSSSSSSSSS